jgi:hypothetical protein
MQTGQNRLGSPVFPDSTLDADTLDVGATIEDVRPPEPSLPGSRELPFGADLVHALLRDAEDRGGHGLADQIVRHDGRLAARGDRSSCTAFDPLGQVPDSKRAQRLAVMRQELG